MFIQANIIVKIVIVKFSNIFLYGSYICIYGYHVFRYGLYLIFIYVFHFYLFNKNKIIEILQTEAKIKFFQAEL